MRAASVVVVLVLACNERPLPGDASTGTGSTGGAAPTSSTSATGASGEAPTTTAVDATTGAPALCGCAGAPAEPLDCDDDATLWAHVPECALAEPCGRVTVECPRPGADLYDCQNELVFAEDALDCVLTAMRDRTPGRFIIEGNVSGNHGYRLTHTLRLPGGEAAVTSTCTSGIEGSIGGSLGGLAPASFFTDCLGQADPDLRYACLFTGVLDKVGLPACAGE